MSVGIRHWREIAKAISVLGWNLALICCYLLITGYLQQWWYTLRLFLARRVNAINYDRLRLERRKYEAGFYQDDARAADTE